MKNFLRNLRARQFEYQSMIEVLIHRDNLLHNYLYFKDKLKAGVGVAPVLKSNAYGHGLVLVAKILDEERPDFLVVDSYFEAMILRNEGIKSPILVIGYTRLENIVRNGLSNVIYTVTDMQWLRHLDQTIKTPVKIHLKIDTGMNRQGIEMTDLEEGMKIIKENSHINLNGICSHLADSDGQDVGFTLKQIKRWNNIVRRVRGEWHDLQYWHLGASSSLFFQEKISANMIRLGLSLYGVQTDTKLVNHLRPVMQVKTIITSVRQVRMGEKIGYNGIFTAPKDMVVATIPVGYNEGLDRRLSGVGWVKARNQFCPIVGRVSMNITSIDVTNIVEAQNFASLYEEQIEVISPVSDDKNSIVNMAKLCGTIPYEIMVHVPEKLRRVVV